jgi:hypothetical protein
MDNYDLLIISDCNNNININIGDIYEVCGNENSTLLYAEIVSGAKGNKKVILESGLQKIVDIDKVRNIITVELDDKTISVLNDINNKCFNNFNNVLKDVNDDRVNNQTCKNIVNNKLLKLRLDANTDIVITSNNVSQKNKVIDTLDALDALDTLDTLDTQLQLSLVNVQFVLELESVNLFYAMEPRIFAIKHRCPKVNIYRTDTIPQTALNFNTTKHIFSNKSIFNKATINYDAGGILTEVCKAPEPKCIVSQTSNIKKGKSKVVHDTPVPTITTSASVPTIPTISTIPSITTSASVPTISTIPTITTSASVPTIPTITTSASVPTIPSITTSASVPTIPSITTSASISTIDNKKEKGKGKSKVVYNTSPLDTSASIPTIDTSAPVLTIDNKKSKSKGKVVNTQTTETKKVRAKVATSSKKLDIS